MTKKKSPGFAGKFVETLAVGNYTDMNGRNVAVTRDYLTSLASNYDPALHEAPAVIGHPETDAPAWGWVSAARVNGDKLEVLFADTDPEFERMVREGRFKKRSLKIYNDPKTAPGGRAPYIAHVGFLGATAPAVKGLKNIHLNEAPGIDIEVAGDITFSEGDKPVDEKEKAELDKTIGERVAAFLKERLGIKDDKPTSSSFSEADVRDLVKDAVADVETKFSAQIAELEKTNKTMKEQLDHQGSASQRAAIVSFLDSVGAERILPAFKQAGVVEFMESLAAIDTKVQVLTLAEEGGKEVEKKVEMAPLEWFQNFLKTMPPFIRLGEQFGELRLAGDGSEIVDPQQVDLLRQSMGVKKPEAAAAKQ